MERFERKEPIIFIFVDGDNLRFIEKSESVTKLSYIKLFKFIIREYFEGKKINISFFFSTAESVKNKNKEGTEKEEDSLRKVDFICNILSEQLEDIRVTYKGFPLSKDSVDVVLSSCIYETLFDYKGKIEKIVLLSGDRDFSRVLRRAKKEGIEVWVISGKESCAGLLEGIANKVLYIEDFVQQSPQLCLSS